MSHNNCCWYLHVEVSSFFSTDRVSACCQMFMMTINMLVPEMSIERFDVRPITEKFMDGIFLMN